MVIYNNIVKAMEKYLEKCAREGAKDSSGIQTPPPQFEQIGERPTTKKVPPITIQTGDDEFIHEEAYDFDGIEIYRIWIRR